MSDQWPSNPDQPSGDTGASGGSGSPAPSGPWTTGGLPPGEPGGGGPPSGWWLASDGRWYPPQPMGYGVPAMPVSRERDKGAVRSLVLGIVGLVFCPIIFSTAAIFEGFQCRKRIRESNGWLDGDGLAIAGLVLGGLGLLMIPVWVAMLNVS